MTVNVPNPVDIRAPIESAHNAVRDAREKQYVTDRVALDVAYHTDLASIQHDKETALVAAGLNTDGSAPGGYGETVPTLPEVGAI